MDRYLSDKQWKPSSNFIITSTSEIIIKEIDKNLSVIAGPGSGKTEILAQRAHFLLQTGKCKFPQRILALSFKNDAAANIKERVRLRCGNETSRRFDAYTFDAFFISIVRRFINLLPEWIKISPDFEVFPFDRNWWHEYEITVLDGRPCQYKSTFDKPNLHAPLDLGQRPNNEIIKIWDYCASKKVVDYAMCRSMAFTIISHNIQVKNLFLSTYKFLFLDEYQDTTDDQYNFIKTIFLGSNTTITAVGDNHQLIMVWAGANPKNFERLKADFQSDIIHLAVNHRSNSKIVSLINHVIKNLTPLGEKVIEYEGTRQSAVHEDCIKIKSFNNSKEESAYISQHIISTMNQGHFLQANDFSLILRQKAKEYFDNAEKIFHENGLSLRNEDALVIPHGLRIQDLMSETLSIIWILLIKRKIDVINYAEEKELENIVSSITGFNLDQDRGYKKNQDFITDLLSIIDLSIPIINSIGEIIRIIGEKRIRATFSQYNPGHLTKVKLSFCKLFQDSIIQSNGDIEKAVESYAGSNQVKLMTIHKSKGLEFDTVFFVDFHSDSWWGLKNAIAYKNINKQKEEKNSFFVGLSRAKERLIFTKNKGDWPPVITTLIKDFDKDFVG